MRIAQLVPSLSYGDAVGNDILALHRILQEFDPETHVYAQLFDEQRIPPGVCSDYREMPQLSAEDILFYHMATGSTTMRNLMLEAPCRKFIIYHNVTPPEFFHAYDRNTERATRDALEDLQALRSVVEGCLAVSEFNRQDLLAAGFRVPIGILPILVPYADYDAEPGREVMSRYRDDGYTNLLFVGRIVPNKKQEDVIRAYAYYKKFINPKSRLFVVGNAGGQDIYNDRLRRYIKALQVEDIIFPGHIPFADILAYYHLADVFLCMSEHEGFCVPLLEAMYLQVPVLAYHATAVPYTMGSAGLIFSDKEPACVACLIDLVTRDKALREAVLESQRQRLEDFSYEQVAAQARMLFRRIVDREDFDAAGCGGSHRTAGELQQQALRQAAEAVSQGELAAFEDIPLQEARPWYRFVMTWIYNFLHGLAPVTAEKIKVFFKKTLHE